MIVQVRYLAQLRQFAGRSIEPVEVPDGCTVAGLLGCLAALRPALGGIILDTASEGKTSLLIFIEDQQVSSESVLHSGDEVTLMTPIAGGEAFASSS